MTYYPFDLQICEIDIGNWAYTNDSVHLYNLCGNITRQEFTENGEWNLDETRAEKRCSKENTHPGKCFPVVKFTLFLTRKISYYLINIICPALFVLTISLAVFWLPPDSGEKVSLGITVLLAFSVFQLVIMDNTPRTSDFTPVMTVLFTIIMGMSAFSVLTSIAVLFYHHHGAEKRPPKVIRFIAFKILARALCMRQHVPDDNQAVPVLQGEKKMTPDLEFTDRGFIERIHMKMDPNGMGNSTRENTMGSCAVNSTMMGNTSMSSISMATLDNTAMGSAAVEFPPPSPRKSHTERDYIKEILQHIRGMMSRVEKKERDDVITDEWKAIANVMDRGFFWIAFTIVFILVPVLLLRKDTSHSPDN